ncbi:MAG: AraC family transcriptional regulator ligand-binding domain-containing protein [Rhizobacter sp.]
MSGRSTGPAPGADAMVAPVFLGPVISEAVRRKVDLRALFRGLEIEAADFDVPGAVISHREAIAMVRRALALVALSGLDLGMRTKITERGVLALGLLAARTLGDAIQLSLRFPQSAGYLLQLRDEPVSNGRVLFAEPFPEEQDLQRFLVDLTFSATVVLRRQVTAADYSPALVELACEMPVDATAHEAFYRCPVHFGCLRNTLFTHVDWLGFKLPWANTMAFRLSTQLLERESERLNMMSAVGASVTRAIRRCLPRIADIAQVAASLNVSERTLRRHLAEGGLSFRGLLDESRKSRALDLMAAGHRAIAQIAAESGFADARAFTRAFKRWTGHLPSLIRPVISIAADLRESSIG